jgi:phosphatidylglycerophosphate synthase
METVYYTSEMVTFSATNNPSEKHVPSATGTPPRRQLVSWLSLGALGTLGSAALISGLQPLGLIAAGVGYLVAASFALFVFRRGFPHPTLGSGNLVTLGRMAMIVSILAALGGNANPWVVVVIASVALALDGVDGLLARRENRVSEFGETLDMEVDSAFTVILAAGTLVAGSIGPLVLLLALPRYVFVAASWVAPWLRGPLPESLARKVICVIQVIALISLQVPGFWGVLTTPIVLAVGAILLWSFGRDGVFLWQARS